MIESILTTALFIWGIHAITREGMIFGFVERFWNSPSRKLKRWIAEMDKATRLWLKSESPEDEKKLTDIENSRPPAPCVPKIAYPISECPTCMASIWGSFAYWAIFAPDYSAQSLAMWPFFVVAVAGACALLSYFDN